MFLSLEFRTLIPPNKDERLNCKDLYCDDIRYDMIRTYAQYYK
jgi:hypothetical protein